MATRDVNLNINVNGEDQIKDVNKELAKTSVSAEKIADQTLKATKGIAGGFELAAQAAGAFGDETGKAFEKTVKRATEYIALSNALKDVAEGFSKENIKGLTGIVSGFQKSGVAAKLFGTTTKAAIASTGIGLLVVAVATLAANWDDVSEAVGDFIDSVPFLKSISDTVTELVDKVGSLSNLFKGIGAFIKGAFTAGASAVDEFNKAIEEGKKVDGINKQLEALEGFNEAAERSIKVLSAQGDKEKEIYALRKAGLDAQIKALEDLKAIEGELEKDNQKKLDDAKASLTILDIENQKYYQKLAEARAKDKLGFAESEANKTKILEDELIARAKLEEDSRKGIIDGVDKVNKAAEARAAKEDELNVIKIDLEKEYVEEVKIAAGRVEEIRQERDENEEKSRQTRREKFEEDVNTIVEYSDLAAETVGSIFSAISENQQRTIDGLQLQIDGINSKFQESVANREALEAELAEADGARRDAIIAGIEAEKAKEKDLAAQRKKLQNEQIKATNKKNQADYVNALIQATISTAQAVLTALASSPPPASFILAAVTAALGAIQIGAIAGNKPKEIPTLATGGYTQGQGFADKTGHEVAGVVHANEYVVPANILNSDSGYRMVAALEAMRQGKPGFATGGFASTPSVDPTNASGGIDPSFLIAALDGVNYSVAVTEINDVSSRVNAIETRASIGG